MVFFCQVTKTTPDVFDFMRKTLLSTQGNSVDVTMVTKDSLQQLVDIGLVIQKRATSQEDQNCEDFHLEVTSLGRATYKGIFLFRFFFIFQYLLHFLAVTLTLHTFVRQI